MKETRIEKVEGGYVLTVQELVGTDIISNAFFFNGLQEARAYGASSFAAA